MAQPPVISLPKVSPSTRDIGFALGIVAILCVLFLPIPVVLVDIGLAFSIALSVLILMVALWIQRPPAAFLVIPDVAADRDHDPPVAEHRDDARHPLPRQ